MSYTQNQAEKDGWTFTGSLTDKGDNRPDHPHFGAHKRAINGELVQKVGASEEQILADIEQWENHHLRAAYVAPPPEESTVPLPDRIALPDEWAKAVAARDAAAVKALNDEGVEAYAVPPHVVEEPTVEKPAAKKTSKRTATAKAGKS